MGLWDTLKEAAGYTPIGLAYKGGKAAYGAAKGAVAGGESAGGQQSYDWTEVERQRANAAAMRAAQEQFGTQLEARARGEGPSVAQEMLAAENEKRMAAAQSMARSARGGGVQQNMAQMQAAQLQQQSMAAAAQQGSLLRAQEQAAAEQAYAQYLMGMRGQDMDAFGAEMAPVMGLGQNQLTWQQAMLQAEQADAASRRQFVGGLFNTAGGMVGMAGGGGGGRG